MDFYNEANTEQRKGVNLNKLFIILSADYRTADVFAVVLCKVYGCAANKMIASRACSADIRETQKTF